MVKREKVEFLGISPRTFFTMENNLWNIHFAVLLYNYLKPSKLVAKLHLTLGNWQQSSHVSIFDNASNQGSNAHGKLSNLLVSLSNATTVLYISSFDQISYFKPPICFHQATSSTETA